MRFTNRYSNGKAFITNCSLQPTKKVEDAIEKLAEYEDLEEQGRLIKFKNYGLTTEQVKNKLLIDQWNKPYGRIIGRIIEADEEYVYAAVYNIADLYDDRKESFSMEICYED